MKNLKQNLKYLCQGLWYLATALLILTLISVLGAKFQGKVPQIMGYSLLRITTGSMEPAIPVGTYILVEDVEPDQIRRGDIICFYSDDPRILGMPNTHRVHEAPIRNQDGVRYITKGDANVIPDPIPATSQNLIGRHVKNLDHLTSLAEFCTTRGMLVIIIGIQVISAVMMSVSLLAFKQKAPDSDPQEDSNESNQEK